MRVRLLALLVVLALGLPAAAAAQYDPRRPPPPLAVDRPRDSGLTLSARLGYGIPGGDISDEGDPPLDDLVERKIPVWIELGYRFNPTVWGGVFLELAPVRVDDAFCLPGVSCNGSSYRLGIDVQFHLAPNRPVDPWFGIGIGAEFLEVESYDPTVDTISEFDFNGIEFPLVEAGVDLALSRRFTLGPYVTWSVGQYTAFHVETPGFATASGRIHDRALHSWLQLGVKATLKL